MPMIITFSDFSIIHSKDIYFVLFLMLFVSFLMVSKIPTYAVKKIKISKNLFILTSLGLVFLFSMLFYKTFETLAVVGLIYFVSVPISFFHYLNLKKKNLN